MTSYRNLKNIKLKYVQSYFCSDDERWYFKIIYEYEDIDDNIHELVFPKIALPFYSAIIPSTEVNYHDNSVFYFMDAPSRLPFFIAKVFNPINNSTEEAAFIDYIIKPAVKKMTKTEIEEKLGYPIEIIGEDDD